MEDVVTLQKNIRVTTSLPITIYVFSKDQLSTFLETNRLKSIFGWLSNLALDIAIGAWFSLKQSGLAFQTILILQTVLWTSILLSSLLGLVAIFFAWKKRKIQSKLISEQITQ
jgi:hypothetical protein